MPGKHVRFASVSTAYPASAPSLSYSVPSVPSSSGPRTPLSSISSLPSSSYYGHSQARPQHKRSQSYPVSTRVHSLLAYSHHPTINYDVSQPTSTITSKYSGLSTTSFSEPAVYPPVSSLMIQIPHHTWPISVHASYNGQYVTVNDVFSTIYHSLRKNVSSSEYHSIPSKKDAERVRMAYEMRYRRIRDRHAYEAEKRQGLRRVDFLNNHTRFLGLTTSTHSSGVWVLHLS
ncbi:hypothetical protein GYMLUDRAFT_48313 [Collybiopsis luxurians FD-317 M1]|uniref:DUF6699 domain-containing protein n=1 Tax=Collybiopsis luxurians FD-317 M1 TaxID=944289 RepID=A0A0D0BJN5_9AGAR|nr:hypothetical protein GYMLUDRAFT_48313 [Collybiopsis luxurians FD-317 M1]